jgi:hypothetical protein
MAVAAALPVIMTDGTYISPNHPQKMVTTSNIPAARQWVFTGMSCMFVSTFQKRQKAGSGRWHRDRRAAAESASGEHGSHA